MGLRDRLKGRSAASATTVVDIPAVEAELQEMSVVELARTAAAQVTAARKGFEFGLPLNSPAGQVVITQDRRVELEQLFQVYLTCPWSSASVDAIARTITAGGIQLYKDADPEGDGKSPALPPNVQALNRLIKYTNPTQDMIQFLRRLVIDLLIFGDAYIEVVWLMGEPVALYTLDPATMVINSDEHGEVINYVQDIDGIHKATFEVDDVIHICMDAPRGGLYGISPTQKAMLSIVAWIFTEACIKECFRKGDPPNVHVDFPQGTKDTDLQRWNEKYMVQNIGARNMGTPITSVGGAVVKELSVRKVADYLAAAKQLRDEILSAYGVQPAKVGVIESGNLGGGTAEGQDKTWKVNTIIPIANLILEKLNFHLVRKGFGIEEWNLQFIEIDFRDSKLVEEIRDMRLRNGSYVLNRYRAEIGEPPVEGGDDAVLVDRQNLVLWRDMEDASAAGIAYKNAPAVNAGMQLDGVKTTTPPAQSTSKSQSGAPGYTSKTNPNGSQDTPGGPGDATQGKPPRESFVYEDEGHKGSMVALFLPPTLAKSLAIPGYEKWQELHVTLAYLTEDAENSGIDRGELERIVADCAKDLPALRGAIQGMGVFNLPDGSKALWVSPDLPDLPAWRQNLVERLEEAGISVKADHGFIPHITLAYVPAGEPVPAIDVATQKVAFRKVFVTWAGERTGFDFGSSGESSVASVDIEALRRSWQARRRTLLREAARELVDA